MIRAMSPATRIPPLPVSERDEEVEQLLAGTLLGRDGEALNIFQTMARHPKLMKRWLPFGGWLLARGVLPTRERELLILRTAWNCQADYEWGHHVELAEGAGITADEIDRITRGPDAPGWDPFEATLIRAADELHAGARITDATWSSLADRYEEQALIEALMVVGQYHLVSFFLNSTGVAREAGVPGLPVRGFVGEGCTASRRRDWSGMASSAARRVLRVGQSSSAP